MNFHRRWRLLAGTFAVLWLAVIAVNTCESRRPGTGPEPSRLALPRLGADLSQTSVSGISSGAYMAGQFHLAHSRIVVGAAIIAGGPYGCAQSAFAEVAGAGATALNAMKAINGCMLNLMAMWGVPDVEALARRAEALAGRGAIDPLDAARKGRIYLFAGREDRIVRPAIVEAAARFYARLGVPRDRIRLVGDVAAGHAFVTETRGNTCAENAAPYVSDCDYDQAGDLLRHIHGALAAPRAGPADEAATGDLAEFDQAPHLAGLDGHSMAARGMVYVPKTCRSATGCRVHIAFHGCAQNRASVGDAFVRHAGYQRWADANRMIILFPEATKSRGNPQGCWDWWGFTGRDYLTRDGLQIRAVRRMLDTLASR